MAELKGTDELYAIKSIRKDKILHIVDKVRLEKDILFSLDYPFLCGMKYFFQTEMRLYFVMPYIKGGELYRIYFHNGCKFEEA